MAIASFGRESAAQRDWESTRRLAWNREESIDICKSPRLSISVNQTNERVLTTCGARSYVCMDTVMRSYTVSDHSSRATYGRFSNETCIDVRLHTLASLKETRRRSNLSSLEDMILMLSMPVTIPCSLCSLRK